MGTTRLIQTIQLRGLMKLLTLGNWKQPWLVSRNSQSLHGSTEHYCLPHFASKAPQRSVYGNPGTRFPTRTTCKVVRLSARSHHVERFLYLTTFLLYPTLTNVM
ncbi:hypothetical protein M427DRAFT_56506, partial [Gonapodya prolifera JEL478]